MTPDGRAHRDPGSTGRARVLLSAYACEPGKGSEPGVGWHWALQAARYHDVWVLTRANNRPAIEAVAEAAGPGRLTFCYYDLPPWVRRWKRGSRGVRAYYALWQLGALRAARRLHRRVGFDIVHHVTFNTMDVPGFLWLLGPPFVWGPVGGGQEPPAALREYFGSRWAGERLRVLRKRAARVNPLVRAAVHRSAAILVANHDTERRLRDLGAAHCVRELETAVDLPPADVAAPHPDGMPFTVLWAGSLILRKGPRLALDALAELKRRGVRFRALIVGDGELAAATRYWTQALGLEAEVELVRSVPHGEMSRWYARSHVLLFTSLHDTSGNVVLEAMAHRLPVVALDQHGVGEMVDASCGLKVPILNQAQVVADLAASLQALASDEPRRRQLGEGARRRVDQEYNWDRKGELMRRLYAEVARPTAALTSPESVPPVSEPPIRNPDAHPPRS